MSENVHVKKEKLGEMIVQSGIASPIDIDHALQSQQVFGGTVGTNLVEAGIIDDDVLAVFLAKQTGIDRVTREELDNIDEATLQLIPLKAAQQLSVIPISKKDQSLTVAMIDPTDTRVIHKIEDNIGFILYPKIAPEFTIHLALKKYYSVPLSPRTSRLLHHQNQQQKEEQSTLKKHLDKHSPSGQAVEFYFKNINDLEAVPIVNQIEDIKDFQLTPELIFIFQQIDGVSTISDMIQMSVFSKLDTLRALIYFYQSELICFDHEFEDEDEEDEED